MKRRCIAVVGMIALAFAYLPGVVTALSANALPTCCSGMLCPMHHMSGGHMTCDMDPAHRSTSAKHARVTIRFSTLPARSSIVSLLR